MVESGLAVNCMTEVCVVNHSTVLSAQSSEYGFPGGIVEKSLPTNAGDTRDAGSIPGSGRSPGVGSGNPLQYLCLGNPTDGRVCWLQSMALQRFGHD